LYDGQCLGVVEFGCAKSKRWLFTRDKIDQVEQVIARRAQPEFVLARPYVLLEKIAEHAMDALGADAAAIYIYEAPPLDDAPLGAPSLAAGAGRADAAFVKKFVPQTGGLGHRALRARVTLCWSPNEVQLQNKELFDAGVRALGGAPMLFEQHAAGRRGRVGLLYVFFRDESHNFTPSEVQALTLLARQAEITIANTLLIDHVKETYRRAPRYSRLLEILRVLPNGNLNEVLTQIVKNILRLLGAINVVLYEYFQDRDEFSKPIATGHFLDPESMNVPMPSDGVARWVLESRVSRFVEDMDNEPDLLDPRAGRTRFAMREGIRASAALVLKDGTDVLGILFVNYRHRVTFSESDRTELHTLASSAGIAISSSRQRKQEEERRRKELDSVRAVEAAIAQADLQNFASVLELILDKGMELVTQASVGVIMLLNPDNQTLSTIAARGFPTELRSPKQQGVNEGIVGLVARTKESQLIRDVKQAVNYKEVIQQADSELAVPIVDGDRVIGVLNFESPRLSAFTELERAQLESLSRQVVLVMRCIQHFQEPIAPKRVLQRIRDRFHPGLTRNASVRVVLTGITAGQGLGFSRAIVLALESQRLQPLVAVGARTRVEAQQVWDRVDREMAQWTELNRVVGETRNSLAERLLAFLIDSAISAPDQASEQQDCPLERFLRDTPLAPVEGALARCVQTAETQIAAGEVHDEFRALLREASGESVSSDRLFVPIEYQKGLVGVLVVDSEFLPEAQQPTMRARFRTGSERTLIDVLTPFAELLGTVLVKGTGN
jgi:GAF domain-containing protein